MRVRERFDDERGAVAVIVGLALIVLLGMLALTVDLGRAVGVRRDMVNAADAAALAAAQECAAGNGSAAATAAANATADLNDTAATLVEIDPGADCVSGGTPSAGLKPVTVTYNRTLDYYVAPVLGFDNVDITTTATAVWGPAQKASPIPIRLNLGALANCGVDFDSETDATCYLLFDNKDETGSASDWGWLYFGGPDGAGWNVPEGTNCSQTNGNLDPQYFLGGGEFTAPLAGVLNDPPPTWVCVYTGNAQTVPRALDAREGDMLVFPVVDPVTYPVPADGSTWPIVAFAPLRVIQLFTQNEQWPAECPASPRHDNSMFCLQLRWEGPVLGGGSLPGSGPYTGLPAVRLVK